MRENDCLSNHPRNSEQEHSGRPCGGWDVTQFENSDAEDRAQKRRDEEPDPVTQARSLENGRTAIGIIDRTENPDDKAEDKQEDRVWRFHGSLSQIGLDVPCGTSIENVPHGTSGRSSVEQRDHGPYRPC